MATDTYREPLTCDECGCFTSRHDNLCSAWTEPAEPIADDAPIPYVMTAQGSESLIGSFAPPLCPICGLHREEICRGYGCHW